MLHIPQHPFSDDERSMLSSMPSSDALKWIADRRCEIMKHLGELDLIHNLCIPINRLPDDVLRELFQCVQGLSSRHSWITVALVCRRWRGVAMTSPTLWNRLDFGDDLQLVRHCIERSANARLDIHIPNKFLDRVQDSAAVLLDVLLPHAHRIRRFNADLHTGQIFQTIFDNFSMPNLECLLLKRPWAQFYPAIVPMDIRWKLTSLTLTCVSTDWNPPAFANLQELSLTALHDGIYHNPTMDTFLDVLEFCRNLRILHLRNAGPDIESLSAYPKPTRIVTLPLLELLTFDGVPINCSHLLDHVALPLSVRLDISIYWVGNANFEGDYVPIVSGLLSRHRPWLFDTESVNRIDVDLTLLLGQGVFNFRVLNPQGSIVFSVDLLYSDFRFEGPTAEKPGLLRHLLRDLAFMFSTCPVRALILKFPTDPVGEDDWRLILRSMPHLERLDVWLDKAATDALLMVLNAGCASGDEGNAPLPACVGIKDLHYHDDPFSSEDLLVSYLARRAAVGHRLRRLDVRLSVYLSSISDLTERLRSLVDELCLR
ncbi:uncharacterized protein FIBRA_03896 [Fibroporia radiculosa]|uniref:F-box domain-containing protein n=1 Tax=Fibroporia radiculosa TaxID=599839 RepID=J4G6I3_9APHY|nr:uncharacterized protein FIBRA_03896 [Fibroporia radiculosa]CCM01828.1 predicted protein [Fibroporia radiculosa]